MIETQLILYFIVGLMGLVAHFLKVKIRKQSPQAIKEWFIDHFSETTLSVIAFIVTFLIAKEMAALNYLSAFAAGYMADSLFSRVKGINKDG